MKKSKIKFATKRFPVYGLNFWYNKKDSEMQLQITSNPFFDGIVNQEFKHIPKGVLKDFAIKTASSDLLDLQDKKRLYFFLDHLRNEIYKEIMEI